ncbi:GFA family protein [Rhizobium sp. TRM95111]|nr:GFA family protein [Rhizobium alarense]
MIFARDDVAFSGSVRSFSVTGGSGLPSHRCFCAACGSQIFGSGPPEDPRWTVYAGTLDDPSEFAPGETVMVRSRPAWDVADHGLPCFETMPPEAGG